MIKVFLLILIVILIIWSFFIEPNLIKIKKLDLNINNMKIVFISDLHIAKNDKKRLQKIVELINKQNPDLVLSGGDYIKGHDEKNTLSIEDQASELKNIKAPIISVLGNHDCWYDKNRVTRVLEKNGIIVLSNSNTKFKNIYIAGVEDLQTGNPDVKKALAGTQGKRILLTHSPDIYYDVKSDVDLILAGHVHGGQVRLPFLGALVVPSEYGNKFSYGLIQETQNKMFITKGLGTSILPIRFNSIPEIVVIN